MSRSRRDGTSAGAGVGQVIPAATGPARAGRPAVVASAPSVAPAPGVLHNRLTPWRQRDRERGAGDPGHQHDPDPGDRRHPEGQLRPPRAAARLRAHGLRVVAAAPQGRPDGADLVRSRPLRAVGRPRLDAAVRPAPPGWLRGVARRPQGVPAVGQQHPRPPRVARDARRRGHHRPARPGQRQRGRHGAGRAVPGHAVQPARPHRRRSLHLRAGLGRRRPGGHLARGGGAGRPPRPGQAHLPVRRQRDHPRRAGLAGDERGRGRALRRLRLAGAACHRRRSRPGRARPGPDRGQGRGQPAVDHHHQDHHRLRLAQEGRHRQRARLAAGRGRGGGDQARARLGRAAVLPRPGRGRRAHGRHRRARPRRPRRLARAAGGVARRPPRAGGQLRRRGGRSAAGRLGPRAADVEGRRQPRHPRRLRQDHGGPGQGGAGAARRRRRPRRLDQDPGAGRRLRSHRRRPQRALRHPRARDGRHGQRHGLPRRPAPVRVDVLRVLRLHAAGGAAGRAQQAAGDLRVDPRLDRPGRGRPDPPAGRAPHASLRAMPGTSTWCARPTPTRRWRRGATP